MSAALAVANKLAPAAKNLITAIENKADACEHYIKTGRTHLMDAMPVTLAQAMRSWSGQIENNLKALTAVLPNIHELALGGTAVGTGINTHPDFARVFAEHLSEATGLPFRHSHGGDLR